MPNAKELGSDAYVNELLSQNLHLMKRCAQLSYEKAELMALKAELETKAQEATKK